MSAAEEDTELRDLLIQNLENSGVLGKIKAEMRAAVFLAMEEQERLQNKTPLVNENLKKCLNSRDGRLVAGLIIDFLQVFNLDFSLSVFQPEINTTGVDSREVLCRDLSLSDGDLNKNCPVLLELVRRGRHKDRPPGGSTEGSKTGTIPEDLSQKQITFARSKFDSYKDHGGSVLKEDLKNVFADLFPSLNKKMLETFISDELRVGERSFSRTVDFQMFLQIYRRLYTQCRIVVLDHSPGCPQEVKGRSVSVIAQESSPLSKGDRSPSSSFSSSVAPLQQRPLVEQDGDDDDGDSFFDDPLPKPQKTYGCPAPLSEDPPPGPLVSPMRRGRSLSEKVETPVVQGSPSGSLSEGQKSGGGAAAGRGGGGRSVCDPSHSKNDEDVEYDDDFNSHRSDPSRSQLSIGDDLDDMEGGSMERGSIEGGSIEAGSIEGPEHSDRDVSTQDLSFSHSSQSHGADYMEEVA